MVKKEEEQKEKLIAVPRAVSVEYMFNEIMDAVGSISLKIDELTKVAKEE